MGKMENGEKLFDLNDPKYPHQNLTMEGKIRPDRIQAWKEMKSEQKKIFAAAMTLKLRRCEYELIKKLTKTHVHLKEGLKGSKEIRDIAKIEPFYSYLIENKDSVIAACQKNLVGAKNTNNYFSRNFGCSPRVFERTTMTYLRIHGKGINGVGGHKGKVNSEIYVRQPEYTVEGVQEYLKNDTQALTMFNGLLAAIERQFEAFKVELLEALK